MCLLFTNIARVICSFDIARVATEDQYVMKDTFLITEDE